jgi:hypothetical protein
MMWMIGQFKNRRRRDLVGVAIVAGAIGLLAATPARAADLDYGPNDGRYQGQPNPYPPRGSVYSVPNDAPMRYGYRPYGYRPYGPVYGPRAWVDPDEVYGDEPNRHEAYRYDRRRDDYDRRPYAELPRPPTAVVPRGPYATDPRDVPPDDMYAEEAPPPYGWRTRPPQRW